MRPRTDFNVTCYVLHAAGEHAAVALYGGDEVRFAICTERGAELRPCEPLIEERAQFVE